MRHAVDEWGRRVRAEYRSAGITADLLQKAIRAGLPDPLLATIVRTVQDELDHARLSHEVREALGADDPIEIDPRELAPLSRPDGPLAELTELVVKHFCLGETFAVPLFQAMRAGCDHPVARPVLDRILRDEAIHRQLGWDALDALLAIDPEGVRGFVEEMLPAWLAAFADAYSPDGEGPELSEAELSTGLLPLDRYRALFAETLAHDIAPRFARRGIPSPY